MPALHFVAANLLGALVYVPYAVGIGYALAYGLSPWLHRAEHVVGKIEHVALLLIALTALLLLLHRLTRARRAA
jgi:membrane protein DedA with SNARE-associated domain